MTTREDAVISSRLLIEGVRVRVVSADGGCGENFLNQICHFDHSDEAIDIPWRTYRSSDWPSDLFPWAVFRFSVPESWGCVPLNKVLEMIDPQRGSEKRFFQACEVLELEKKR